MLTSSMLMIRVECSILGGWLDATYLVMIHVTLHLTRLKTTRKNVKTPSHQNCESR